MHHSKEKRRARERGIIIGSMKPGKRNLITDVDGVSVGHCTIRTAKNRTGITVIMPCSDNPFTNRLTAADFVWNGFGKTAGLVQIDELGRLESPIVLTSTLNVGRMQDALVRYMIARCRKEGVRIASFSPVVGECNDSGLNDVTLQAADYPQLMEAIDAASSDFALGDVGAGTGTQCHGLKGGIGSASRTLEIGGKTYTLGILVQSNYGRLEDLQISGRPYGRTIAAEINAEKEPDKGSIMMIAATDLPLNDRQLRRVLKRASIGLARMGSYAGHGSGEIMIGFTTADRIPSDPSISVIAQSVLREELLDDAFRAIAECCEEAVLDSMLMASPAVFQDGRILHSLAEFI